MVVKYWFNDSVIASWSCGSFPSTTRFWISRTSSLPSETLRSMFQKALGIVAFFRLLVIPSCFPVHISNVAIFKTGNGKSGKGESLKAGIFKTGNL